MLLLLNILPALKSEGAFMSLILMNPNLKRIHNLETKNLLINSQLVTFELKKEKEKNISYS